MLFECEGCPWDFLGDAAVKTAHFHCRGAPVQSLVRKLTTHKLCGTAKKMQRGVHKDSKKVTVTREKVPELQYQQQ